MLMIFLSWNMWNANTLQKPPIELRITSANKTHMVKIGWQTEAPDKGRGRMDHSHVRLGCRAQVLNPKALRWHKKGTQSPNKPIFPKNHLVSQKQGHPVVPSRATLRCHQPQPGTSSRRAPPYSLILHHVHNHPVERVDILPNEVLKHDECLHQEILK